MRIGPAVARDHRVRYLGRRHPEYLFPPFEWYGWRGSAAPAVVTARGLPLSLARRVRLRGLRFAVIPAAADFDLVLLVVACAVFRFVLVISTSGLGWLAPSRHRHPFGPRRICRLGPRTAGGSRVLGSATSMHASFAGEVQWKPTVLSRNHSAIDVCNPAVGASLVALSGWAARSVARSPRYPWPPRRDTQSRRRRSGTAMMVAGARNHRELTLKVAV